VIQKIQGACPRRLKRVQDAQGGVHWKWTTVPSSEVSITRSQDKGPKRGLLSREVCLAVSERVFDFFIDTRIISWERLEIRSLVSSGEYREIREQQGFHIS